MTIQLPKKPIDTLTAPLKKFMHMEAASGVVLLFVTVLALVLANSPYGHHIHNFWQIPIGLSIAGWNASLSIELIINDALMAIFFFVIGLEVKREFVVGEMREFRSAILPIAAAIGGMVAPALIYLYFAQGWAPAHGWGIPMATDIAFVVGCMALLSSRVSHSLRVFLLMLAIVDDIGAVLVIAIGYTDNLNLDYLFAGFAFIALFIGLLRSGVLSLPVLLPVAIAVWSCFMVSGVHATIAGVILGLLIPARPDLQKGFISELIEDIKDFIHDEDDEQPGNSVSKISEARTALSAAISPLDSLMHTLHPWVGFLIMPLFAFCNAGVELHFSSVLSGVSIAIIAGLVLGKPLGIVTATLAVVYLKLAKLPDSINLRTLIGGGFLAGIGFTMALFIANLALTPDILGDAKVGILVGSLISAIVGSTIILTARSLELSGTNNNPPSPD